MVDQFSSCCCVQASGNRSNGSLCISRHVWSGIVLVCNSGEGGLAVSAGSYSETTLHYTTSTPFLVNQHSKEVPRLFGAIIRTAGAWAAARLRGGWERARPQRTQEGLLYLLSCQPTHPHPSFFIP